MTSKDEYGREGKLLDLFNAPPPPPPPPKAADDDGDAAPVEVLKRPDEAALADNKPKSEILALFNAPPPPPPPPRKKEKEESFGLSR